MVNQDLEKRYRGLHYEIGRMPEWLTHSAWYWKFPHAFRVLLFKALSPRSISGVRELRLISQNPNAHSIQPFLETKSLFVHIPKTAGISVGVSLYGRKTGDHRTMADYELCFTKAEFQSLYKFTFVRNPWDRLLSAYSYMKLGGRNKEDHDWSVKNLSAYESFDQFVKEWVNEENIRSGLHFRPQHEFLRLKDGPLPVDFIGHFETIAADYDRIRSKIGTGSELAEMNKTAKKPKDYRQSYSAESKKIVGHVYQKDVELFGYVFDAAKSL